MPWRAAACGLAGCLVADVDPHMAVQLLVYLLCRVALVKSGDEQQLMLVFIGGDQPVQQLSSSFTCCGTQCCVV